MVLSNSKDGIFNPNRFLKGKLNPAISDGMVAGTSLSCNGHVLTSFFRICPGRHMVQSFVWIIYASILAMMNIDKPLDEHGNVIKGI